MQLLPCSKFLTESSETSHRVTIMPLCALQEVWRGLVSVHNHQAFLIQCPSCALELMDNPRKGN